jgi:hypothetical protein
VPPGIAAKHMRRSQPGPEHLFLNHDLLPLQKPLPYKKRDGGALPSSYYLVPASRIRPAQFREKWRMGITQPKVRTPLALP